jgi:SWI/SNF-related matrix-associated actin-dependent regulator of chromatin subfamily A3
MKLLRMQSDIRGESAKLDKLMEVLLAAEARTAGDGAGTSQQPASTASHKSVVFSQFTGMLSLVEVRLRAAGIPYIRIDGSVPGARRHVLLSAFAKADADSPRVAVMSLKACGTGLNLVAASEVHLLDPWWNPATEEQAMDRVHRIGQRRPVRVYRCALAQRNLDVKSAAPRVPFAAVSAPFCADLATSSLDTGPLARASGGSVPHLSSHRV